MTGRPVRRITSRVGSKPPARQHPDTRLPPEDDVKVDVAINYFGKPYQTLLTIESLLEHSDRHLDLIYLIKEPQQPRADEDMAVLTLSLIHISEPTRRTPISYAVFCLKK